MAKKEDTKINEAIHIAPPNIQNAEVWILGRSPLVIHKFSRKAREAIRAKQEAGSLANKSKKKESKDFGSEVL